MHIRTRIILWITGSGLLAALLFSIVIFAELIEQPYEILDQELATQADMVATALIQEKKCTTKQEDVRALLDLLGSRYWIEASDVEHHPVYVSSLAKLVQLPFRRIESGYNQRVALPSEAPDMGQDRSSLVMLRVRSIPISRNGVTLLVRIAKPMEHLEEEIRELIWSIAAGLAFFSMTLFIFSYLAAERILLPIRAIGDLARNIKDTTLNRRIPLGKNRDELYSLAILLNSMFDRLQFSFQRQKEFIAAGAHELKTPLALQRLFWEEMRQRDDLPHDLYPQLEAQTKTHHRLERLVRNLLDLSALESRDRVDMERFDCTKLVYDVAADFEDICQVLKIAMEKHIEKNVTLEADREKIRCVVINLMDNAVKYTEGKDKRIRLTLRQEPHQVVFTVFNSGPGIPREERERVFDQFYRIEKSRSTMLGGAGLGLALVKRIVDLHQGSIELTSAPGAWTQFKIRLPSVPCPSSQQS